MSAKKKIFLLIFFSVLTTSIFLSGCVSNSESEQISNSDEQNEQDISAGLVKLNITDEKASTEMPSPRAKGSGNIIIIDHTTTSIDEVPESCIIKAKENLRIAYTHTSHGGQLISGIDAISEYNSLYSFGNTEEKGVLHLEDYNGFSTGSCPDLSQCNGNIASHTKKFLDSSDNEEINVIMWSWCDIAGHDIETYLNDMQELIKEYEDGSAKHPVPVKFVFMTGHANGGGEGDSSDVQNKKIREFIFDDSKDAFCKSHECILFDFSDIENYDPDGRYFLDKNLNDALFYDGGNWGLDYLSRHPSGTHAEITERVSGCAHSDENDGSRLNCALKGQAAWYMFARIAGWDGESKSC